LNDNRTIDELLDRAVSAINRGDRATADALAGQVLAVDGSNLDAEELLATPADSGELRRLTMLFADLVDSTALSTQVEPEVYRTVVGRYRDDVDRIVNRYEGHVASIKGDGLFAIFGHPKAHENDAYRAVQTGLEITRAVAALSQRVRRRFGFDIETRVGIHRGLVYLDVVGDDVYGLGANLAARVCSLAEPGTVAVSSAIERVVRDHFDLAESPPQAVKGVEGPIVHYRVLAERDGTTATSGPLVGRDDELSYLTASWAQAVTGDLTAPGVLFRGDGGIGKSRLSRAAVDLAEQSDAVVLELYGSPFHTDVGLRPVRRFLERQSGIKRGSDAQESLRRLEAELRIRAMDPAAFVPLFAPILGIPPEGNYQPAAAKAGTLLDQIMSGVKDYLLACAGTGPALVVVEDIHWFDEDTVEVVRALLGEELGRMLVVTTGRHSPVTLPSTKVFDLTPLDATQSDALIAALHPQMSPQDRVAVRERCDGIPLYIEEVVAKLRDQSMDGGQQAEVPDTLYETLVARIRHNSNASLVLEAAALIGRLIDRRLLHSVVQLDDGEIDQLLEQLTRGRVLAQIGKNSWRFHHELLREVAAELSPPSVRRRLHSRIADSLSDTTSRATPEWPLVAHHYEQAERFDEAAGAYEKASANARQRGALSEARNHLVRALTNIEKLPEDLARDRLEIRIRLQSGFLASAATGHASTEAASEFERCLELIGPEPGPELYATFSALWSYYATRGDLERAATLIDALGMNSEELPEWQRAANDAAVGTLAVLRGEFREARSILEAATSEGSSLLGSPEIDGAWFAPNDPVAGLYAFVAFARFVQGELSSIDEAFAQLEARCAKLRFPHGPFSLCYGRSLELGIRAEAGQLQRAAELVDELTQRGQQSGFDEWVMIAASHQASIGARFYLAGTERDSATLQAFIDGMTAIVGAWRAFELNAFLAYYDGLLARLLTAAGQHDSARAHLALSLQMSADTGMHFYDAELIRIRASTYEDTPSRQSDLQHAIELARKQGALVYELRAALDDFELTGEPARAELEDVLTRFPSGQDWPELGRAKALLE
jgi:class 3 adenylate cyclase/tetratricopeptide (TPR) repeat protein